MTHGAASRPAIDEPDMRAKANAAEVVGRESVVLMRSASASRTAVPSAPPTPCGPVEIRRRRSSAELPASDVARLRLGGPVETPPASSWARRGPDSGCDRRDGATRCRAERCSAVRDCASRRRADRRCRRRASTSVGPAGPVNCSTWISIPETRAAAARSCSASTSLEEWAPAGHAPRTAGSRSQVVARAGPADLDSLVDPEQDEMRAEPFSPVARPQ